MGLPEAERMERGWSRGQRTGLRRDKERVRGRWRRRGRNTPNHESQHRPRPNHKKPNPPPQQANEHLQFTEFSSLKARLPIPGEGRKPDWTSGLDLKLAFVNDIRWFVPHGSTSFAGSRALPA